MSNTPAPPKLPPLPALRVVAALAGSVTYKCCTACQTRHTAHRVGNSAYYTLTTTCDHNPRYTDAKARPDVLNNLLVVVEVAG